MFVLNPACAKPETSQASIKDLAERCLRSNPYLALKNISCELLDGVLVLRGCLPTYYLKQIAQQAIAGLNGVDRIDNQIHVGTPNVRSDQS
jgi:osmotically-inducible protein OsmY